MSPPTPASDSLVTSAATDKDKENSPTSPEFDELIAIFDVRNSRPPILQYAPPSSLSGLETIWEDRERNPPQGSRIAYHFTLDDYITAISTALKISNPGVIVRRVVAPENYPFDLMIERFRRSRPGWIVVREREPLPTYWPPYFFDYLFILRFIKHPTGDNENSQNTMERRGRGRVYRCRTPQARSNSRAVSKGWTCVSLLHITVKELC
jgi:hypothetical protein